MEYVDLNRPPHERLAGTIRRVGRPANQRVSGPPGVIDVRDGDVLWDDPTAPDGRRSVKDILDDARVEMTVIQSELTTNLTELDTELESARERITDTEESLAAADALLNQTRTEIAQSGAELATRLEGIDTKLSQNSTKAQDAHNAAAAAQDAADTAKSDAATAAGIAEGKADVLIQPAAPATAMRKATTLWIDTTGGTNTPKRWSGSAWVEVTDKAAKDAAQAAADAQTAANNAQSRADAAHTLASTADGKATTALTSANGRNNIILSTAGPSGTTNPDTGQPNVKGDTWWRRDAQNNVIGQWTWDGSKWLATTINHEVIASVDINKLVVTGTAKISEAVIDKLWTDVVRSKKITTDMLQVGSGNNLIPYVASPASDREHWFNRYGGSGNGPSWIADAGNVSGGTNAHLFMNASWVNPGIDTIVWELRPRNSSTGVAVGVGFPVTKGESYKASAFFRLGGSYSSGTPEARIGIYFYAEDGAYLSAASSSPRAVTWAWLLHEASAEVPAGAAFMRIYYRQNQPGGLRVDRPALNRMTDASLIVDGGIVARHMTVAGELNAEIGNIIRANFRHLTVTEVANISQAVLDNVWARQIAANKIYADQVLIGSGENLIADPFFQNDTLSAQRNAFSSPEWTVNKGSNWFYSYPTAGSNAALNLSNSAASNYQSMDLVAGRTYRVRYEVFLSAGMTAQTRTAWHITRSDGTTSYVGDGTAFRSVSAGWTTVERTYTVPADVTTGGFVIQINSVTGGGLVRVRGVVMSGMTDASLIVDGGIVGRHIRALELQADSRIIAGNPSGTRAEVNAAGITAYSGTTKTVDLNGTNNLLVGDFKTAGSGARVEIVRQRGIHASDSIIGLYSTSGGTSAGLAIRTNFTTVSGPTITASGVVELRLESSGVEFVPMGITTSPEFVQPVVINETGWVGITPAGGAAGASGPASAPFAWRKHVDVIYLRGALTRNWTEGTHTIGTLPASSRPAYDTPITLAYGAGVAATGIVRQSGAIQIIPTTYGNATIHLNGSWLLG